MQKLTKIFVLAALFFLTIVGGRFVAMANTLPPVAILSSTFNNVEIKNTFDVSVLIYPQSLACQSSRLGFGYIAKNSVTGSKTEYLVRTISVTSFRLRETISITPKGWKPGKYEILPLVIDGCSNRPKDSQLTGITISIPSVTEVQFLSPNLNSELTANTKLTIAVKFDAFALQETVDAVQPRTISFSSSTLNKNIFNCKNLKSDKQFTELNILDLPQQNCSFEIKPFAGYFGTYEWLMDTSLFPTGLHQIQVTLVDIQSNQFSKSTQIYVPAPTTTLIEECSQNPCGKKFSGKSRVTVAGRVDTQAKVSIKEVGLQIEGKNLAGNDQQGNAYLKTDFNGIRNDSLAGTTWTISDSTTRFSMLLDTTSWDNGTYRLNSYTIDSRGVRSIASTTITVENSGPIIDFNSIRVPKGDVQQGLRLAINVNSQPESSAQIKKVKVLVNGVATTTGITPEFNFTSIGNAEWDVTNQKQFIWTLKIAPPRSILEKQQAGFFALNADKENSAGQYVDSFQFVITDTYGRQSQTSVYQSEITCGPCKKLVVRDSSVSAQGGDVSKAQLISFDVDVPSQAISTVSRVRVVRDGKPVTEGLEPQFENSGIRGDGWAVDKGSKFSWKLKFGTSDQIIFDNQKGVWSVQVADDPEVDPRISSKLAFEVVDNFGRVTTSLVIPEFLITCLECEKRIKEGLKNIRLAKRYQRDAQLALDNIDAYLSTTQGYLGALNGLASQAESDKKNSETEIKRLISGFKHTFPATKSRTKITVIITENRWDQTCSNQNSRPDGEKKLGAAKGAYEVSEQAWSAFRGGVATVNSSIGTIRDRRSTSNTALTRLKNIANSEVVSNEQVKEAKSLLDDILKYEKEASGEVNQARNGKDSAENRFKEIDQIKEIKKLVDIFFKSAIACLSGEERLSTTQGSVDGDKSATKTKGVSAILCVSPDGKQRQVVKGASPKCPAGLTKKNY